MQSASKHGQTDHSRLVLLALDSLISADYTDCFFILLWHFIDDLKWQRISLGSQNDTRVLYENSKFQQPFLRTGRYSERHQTTDSYVQSQIKISNIQKTDVGDYNCIAKDDDVGTFRVDVIGK